MPSDTHSSDSGSHADGPQHSGRPVSDYDTKTALMVASHEDVLAVDGYGEMSVTKRTDTYYGPNIKLTDGDDNYLLVPAGFADDPELWRAVTDEDGFVEGYDQIDNVGVEVAEVANPPQCECGELLESQREKREAFIAGVCPHA